MSAAAGASWLAGCTALTRYQSSIQHQLLSPQLLSQHGAASIHAGHVCGHKIYSTGAITQHTQGGGERLPRTPAQITTPPRLLSSPSPDLFSTQQPSTKHSSQYMRRETQATHSRPLGTKRQIKGRLFRSDFCPITTAGREQKQ